MFPGVFLVINSWQIQLKCASRQCTRDSMHTSHLNPGSVVGSGSELLPFWIKPQPLVTVSWHLKSRHWEFSSSSGGVFVSSISENQTAWCVGGEDVSLEGTLLASANQISPRMQGQCGLARVWRHPDSTNPDSAFLEGLPSRCWSLLCLYIRQGDR